MSQLLVGLPHPGIVLLVALLMGQLRRPVDGVVAAFAGGLVLDALAGPPLGRVTLALLVAVLLLYIRYTDLALRIVVAPVISAAVATILYWLVLGLVDAGVGRAVPWLPWTLRWMLPSVVMNALLVMPLFFVAEMFRLRRQPGLAGR